MHLSECVLSSHDKGPSASDPREYQGLLQMRLRGIRKLGMHVGDRLILANSASSLFMLFLINTWSFWVALGVPPPVHMALLNSAFLDVSCSYLFPSHSNQVNPQIMQVMVVHGPHLQLSSRVEGETLFTSSRGYNMQISSSPQVSSAVLACLGDWHQMPNLLYLTSSLTDRKFLLISTCEALGNCPGQELF